MLRGHRRKMYKRFIALTKPVAVTSYSPRLVTDWLFEHHVTLKELTVVLGLARAEYNYFRNNCVTNLTDI